MSNSKAQQFESFESKILVDGVSMNSLTSEIDGSKESVEKAWKKYFKSQFGESLKSKNDRLESKLIEIRQITDKRSEIITVIYNNEKKVSLNVICKVGPDVYLNSTQFSKDFKNLKSSLDHFNYIYYNDYYAEFIKEREKSLKSLSKSDKSLKSKNKSLARKIEKKEKKIAKLNKKNGDFNTIKEYETEVNNLKEEKRVNQEIWDGVQNNKSLVEEDIKVAKLNMIVVKAKLNEFGVVK